MSDLPIKALSVRQPWAWALIYGGKNIENRSQASIRHMDFRNVKSFCIHAAKGMTRDEYESGAEFMRSMGIACPHARDLLRGGIIGVVDFVYVVKKSISPWFFGPCGIVISHPRPCDFVPSAGALGLFDWQRSGGGSLAPAKWMLAQKPKESDRLLFEPIEHHDV